MREDINTTSFGVHCEPCRQWTKLDEIPDVYECITCERVYRIELVIYEEVILDGD